MRSERMRKIFAGDISANKNFIKATMHNRMKMKIYACITLFTLYIYLQIRVHSDFAK